MQQLATYKTDSERWQHIAKESKRQLKGANDIKIYEKTTEDSKRQHDIQKPSNIKLITTKYQQSIATEFEI